MNNQQILSIDKRTINFHKKLLKRQFKQLFSKKKELYTFLIKTFFNKYNSNFSLTITLIEFYRVIKKVKKLTEDDYLLFSKIALYKIIELTDPIEHLSDLNLTQNIKQEIEGLSGFEINTSQSKIIANFKLENGFDYAIKASDCAFKIAKYFIDAFKINEVDQLTLVEWISCYGAYSEINWFHIIFKKNKVNDSNDDKYYSWMNNHFKAQEILLYLQKKIREILSLEFNHIILATNLVANRG